MALSSEGDFRPPRHRRVPILSREEENALFLLTKAGDERARDRLITANIGVVWTIAFTFRRYGVPVEDLANEGCIGLIEALAKYEPERGLKFASYAVYWVRARIYDLIKEMHGVVCINTSGDSSKAFFRVRSTRSELEKAGQIPTDEELAKALEISPEICSAVAFWLERPPLSLSQKTFADDPTTTLSDSVADPNPSPEELLVENDSASKVRAAIRVALKALPPRERRIIQRCVLSDDPETCQALADEMNLSRERIRQLKASAIARMAKALRESNVWR